MSGMPLSSMECRKRTASDISVFVWPSLSLSDVHVVPRHHRTEADAEALRDTQQRQMQQPINQSINTAHAAFGNRVAPRSAIVSRNSAVNAHEAYTTG